jgi:hypothetical protein
LHSNPDIEDGVEKDVQARVCFQWRQWSIERRHDRGLFVFFVNLWLRFCASRVYGLLFLLRFLCLLLLLLKLAKLFQRRQALLLNVLLLLRLRLVVAISAVFLLLWLWLLHLGQLSWRLKLLA